jgi:riboflavin-specific deaminase-like protein
LYTAQVVGRVLDDLRQAEARKSANAAIHERRRPFVTLAWAQSVDGSIALEAGRRYAVSGQESLSLTHALRAEHDAILVGIGTLLADDPQLTVRLWEGRSPNPVVLDSRLRTPLSSRLVADAGIRPLRIACTAAADAGGRALLEARGAEVLCLPAWSNGWVDLDELLCSLYQVGVRKLMVEGGAKVLTSFLRASLGDFAVVTVAPVLLGGLPAVGALERGHLPRLRDVASHRLGDDWVLEGALRWGEA